MFKSEGTGVVGASQRRSATVLVADQCDTFRRDRLGRRLVQTIQVCAVALVAGAMVMCAPTRPELECGGPDLLIFVPSNVGDPGNPSGSEFVGLGEGEGETEGHARDEAIKDAFRKHVESKFTCQFCPGTIMECSKIVDGFRTGRASVTNTLDPTKTCTQRTDLMVLDDDGNRVSQKPWFCKGTVTVDKQDPGWAWAHCEACPEGEPGCGPEEGEKTPSDEDDLGDSESCPDDEAKESEEVLVF